MTKPDEISFSEFLSQKDPMIFLSFSENRLLENTYEVKMNFIALDRLFQLKEKETIGSLNFFKHLSKKVVSVWAPYKIIGETTQLDLYQKGKVIRRVCNFTSSRRLYFNKSMIKYQFGLLGILEPTSEIEKVLSNQYFAYYNLEKENKCFVIPCSEIYTAYFGKFQSAILQATFEGIEIYDPNYIPDKESSNPADIKLRKQFTEASVKLAYRMCHDKAFEKAFKNTRVRLLDNPKGLYAEFPFSVVNELIVDYISLSKTVNLIVQIRSIKSDFKFPEKIIYDTDINPGEEIDENTEKLPATRVNGISTFDGQEVCFTNNQPNEIFSPNVVNMRPNEDIDGKVEVKKVHKESKKTVSEQTVNIVQQVNEDSYGGSGDTKPGTVIRSNESVIDNDIPTYSFKNLENLILDLTNSKEFKSICYYNKKPSHELTDKKYNGSKIWPYLKKEKKTWTGFRKVGLVELNYNEKYLYILEIEKRRETEKFSLGIIYTDDFSILTEAQFNILKETILKHNGALQKMFIKKKIDNSNIIGKSLNHTTGSTKMVDRIINQIKEIVPK